MAVTNKLENNYLYMENSIKLVTQYFKHDNVIDYSLSIRISFSKLSNSFVITVFSGLKLSLVVVTEIFTSIQKFISSC